VVRIDAATGEVAATVSAGGAVCPYLRSGDPVDITAGDGSIWVTDAVNGSVSRIAETTNQADEPIRVGDTPTAIAVGLGSVWVAVDGKESPSPSTS
jgi:DNA-binding beta-propeller fold protein YncE